MNDREGEPSIMRDLGGGNESVEKPDSAIGRKEKLREHLIERHIQRASAEGGAIEPQAERQKWIEINNEHFEDIVNDEDGSVMLDRFESTKTRDRIAQDMEHKINERQGEGDELADDEGQLEDEAESDE